MNQNGTSRVFYLVGEIMIQLSGARLGEPNWEKFNFVKNFLQHGLTLAFSNTDYNKQ